MKSKRILPFIFIMAMLGFNAKGHAAPILLASTAAAASGTLPQQGALTPEGAVFVLGFRDTNQGNSFDCAPYIGCEKVWDFGETGSIDFTQNNTDANTYLSIVEKLTNGIDEPVELLSRGAWTINTNSSSVFPGGIGSGPESFLNIPLNATIDFIRLVVSEVSSTTTTFSNGAESTRLNYVGAFQIWGNPPTTVEASAPSMTALLTMFFGLILIKRRWNR